MSARAIATVVAAVVAGFLALSHPASADELLDGLKTLPGSVEDVRVGGTWDRDGKSGIYRVIVSRSGGDAITARLFIQWVAYEDDGSLTVQDTIEIQELADLKVDIVDFTSESDADGLSVFLQTLDPDGSADGNYELIVTSPYAAQIRACVELTAAAQADSVFRDPTSVYRKGRLSLT